VNSDDEDDFQDQPKVTKKPSVVVTDPLSIVS